MKNSNTRRKQIIEDIRRKREIESKHYFARISRETGLSIKCDADMENIIDDFLLKSVTCKSCGMDCKNEHGFQKHIGSVACLKRQARQKGTVYVEPREQYELCEVCGVSIKRRNLDAHRLSKAHTDKMAEMVKRNEGTPVNYKCSVCDQLFKGKRAKRNIIKHCQTSKKHLKLIKHADCQAMEKAMSKAYGVTFR